MAGAADIPHGGNDLGVQNVGAGAPGLANAGGAINTQTPGLDFLMTEGLDFLMTEAGDFLMTEG